MNRDVPEPARAMVIFLKDGRCSTSLPPWAQWGHWALSTILVPKRFAPAAQLCCGCGQTLWHTPVPGQHRAGTSLPSQSKQQMKLDPEERASRNHAHHETPSSSSISVRASLAAQAVVERTSTRCLRHLKSGGSCRQPLSPGTPGRTARGLGGPRSWAAQCRESHWCKPAEKCQGSKISLGGADFKHLLANYRHCPYYPSFEIVPIGFIWRRHRSRFVVLAQILLALGYCGGVFAMLSAASDGYNKAPTNPGEGRRASRRKNPPCKLQGWWERRGAGTPEQQLPYHCQGSGVLEGKR